MFGFRGSHEGGKESVAVASCRRAANGGRMPPLRHKMPILPGAPRLGEGSAVLAEWRCWPEDMTIGGGPRFTAQVMLSLSGVHAPQMSPENSRDLLDGLGIVMQVFVLFLDEQFAFNAGDAGAGDGDDAVGWLAAEGASAGADD